MLVNRYYVIYVEVPSGYPGVEMIGSQMTDKNEIVKMIKRIRPYAILDILEVRN